MEKLHLGVRWVFRFTAYGTLAIINVLIFGFSIIKFNFFGISYIFILPIYLLITFIIGEIYARLAYNNWNYEFTKTNLKIEKGIIWKKYSNIPYERVQNVDVQRGILARMLGFSSVNIQTAGYSGYHSGPMKSEGHIPAVGMQRAEEIRDFVMKKIGRKQGM